MSGPALRRSSQMDREKLLPPAAARNREGRVGHPLPGRIPAPLPLQRRPRRAPLQGPHAEGHRGDRPHAAGRRRSAPASARLQRARPRLRAAGRGPLPRQHLAAAPLLQRRAAGDPAADPHLRRAESARRAARRRPAAARLRARHGRDGHGQVDHARDDDRGDQPRRGSRRS